MYGYADDMYVMGSSMQTFERIYRGLEEHSKTTGLRTEGMETNVLLQSGRDLSRQQREIEDTEAVDSFTSIGTKFTEGNQELIEIQKGNNSTHEASFPISHHKIRVSA